MTASATTRQAPESSSQGLADRQPASRGPLLETVGPETALGAVSTPPRQRATTEVSVIIPAYNEANRIGPTITAAASYLLAQAYSSEIILVDDGSCDGTVVVARRAFQAATVGRETGAATVHFRTLVNPGNRGKGFSIRHGFAQARARYVFFSDADLSTPIEELDKLLGELQSGADLAVGSRALPDSVVNQPSVLRRLMSAVLRLVVRTLSVPTASDTQCGFKGYRQETARRLSQLQQVDGYSFDIEHLYVARRLGLRTVEVPVRWTHVEGSKVRPLRDACRMLWDLWRIRKAHVSLKAPDVASVANPMREAGVLCPRLTGGDTASDCR